MSEFLKKDFRGVIPALVTCFDEREEIDEKRMRAVVRWLLDTGVNGLYLTGSTGEAFLMSAEERMRVTEMVLDEVHGKVPVIVHVGNIGTKLSKELAVHAEKAGANAVSSVPPFYWKFGDDSIVRYYQELSEATSLPMIAYNIPLAGSMGFPLIRRIAQIPQIKGIKYTLSSHHEIMRIKEEIGSDFLVYSGADEMAMSGLSFGADGLIGSFYNLIPEVFLTLYRAVQAGDLALAREQQRLADKIIFAALEYDYIPLMKRMMAWMGLDAGYSRRPFTQFSVEEEIAAKARFTGLLRDEAPVTCRFVAAMIK